MHWWFEHMGGMLGSCIATVTAFVAVNAPRLGLGSSGSLIAWTAPPVVGGVGLTLWIRYYRRKFNPRRSEPASVRAAPL